MVALPRLPGNLQHYLSTHLTGASGATAMLRSLADRLDADDLRQVVAELEDEQRQVRDVMDRMDISPSTTSRLAARVAEAGSRVVRGAQGLYDQELRNLTELEAMITGIAGKKAMWRLLGDLTDAHPALGALDLDGLHAQGDRQQEVVDARRRAAGRRALS